MSIGQHNGRLTGLVSRFGRPGARPENGNGSVVVEPHPAAAVAVEPVHSSKTLAQFLSMVSQRPAAELVDLGPVIGSNISFLDDRVGCSKIHVEDLYRDIDRHAREGTLEQFGEFLGTRFPTRTRSADAVLCWDVFDYLAPPAAAALADKVKRMLRPHGLMLAFFGARASDDTRYTRYCIEDESHLRARYYPSACPRRWVLQNRDINFLFAGLEIFDSLLLKSGVREILFRKPL